MKSGLPKTTNIIQNFLSALIFLSLISCGGDGDSSADNDLSSQTIDERASADTVEPGEEEQSGDEEQNGEEEQPDDDEQNNEEEQPGEEEQNNEEEQPGEQQPVPISTSSYNPINAATSVSLDAVISIFFSDSVAGDAFNIQVTLSNATDTLPGVMTISGNQAIFTPDEALTFKMSYTVSLSNGPGATEQIPEQNWSFTTRIESAALLFENVTNTVIDWSPELNTHFWAGAPDVNNDGCIDLYVAEHRDGGHDEDNVPTDDINSSMFIHDVVDGRCANRWSYFADVENYSQSSPQVPRITSNNSWGNFTGNEKGYWSFGGIDADGSDPAFYEINDVNAQGQPIYKTKRNSNCGSRHLCIYGDFNGDGDIDLFKADRDSEESTLVVDDETGAVLINVDTEVGSKDLDAVNMMLDVNGDSWPDIYVVKDGGYWRNNDGESFTWVANLHSDFGNPSGTDTARRNLGHQIMLDYDSDGDQDIFGTSGQNLVDGAFCFKLYRNNGTDFWDDVTAISGLDNCPAHSESYWTIPYSNSTIGDLNSDGFMDVVMFGETYGNTATLIMNNGDGTFTIDRSNDFGQAFNASDVGKSHGQVRDIDGDGRPDIIKTQDRSSDNHAAIGVWKNQTLTDNRWLTVRTRGLGENTDGI
ncbi:MAG: VCBS repeat-containing protein, partial [Pseudomonadales bacterium]|nr:VCBS repeat-containing protein [Pseudomonadales bacterium]